MALQLADQLADREQIGQRLARMAEIGQAVDDRAIAVMRQFDRCLVMIGADHDDVNVLAEHAGEIGDALSVAEPGFVAQEDRTSAEMGHAGLEADASAQRRFFKDQSHDPARQERLAQAGFALLLQIFRDREDAFDFGCGYVGQCQ